MASEFERLLANPPNFALAEASLNPPLPHHDFPAAEEALDARSPLQAVEPPAQAPSLTGAVDYLNKQAQHYLGPHAYQGITNVLEMLTPAPVPRDVMEAGSEVAKANTPGGYLGGLGNLGLAMAGVLPGAKVARQQRRMLGNAEAGSTPDAFQPKAGRETVASTAWAGKSPYERADEIAAALRAEYGDDIRDVVKSGSAAGPSAYIRTKYGDIRVSDHYANPDYRPGQAMDVGSDTPERVLEGLKVGLAKAKRAKQEKAIAEPIWEEYRRVKASLEKEHASEISAELARRGQSHLKANARKEARREIIEDLRAAGKWRPLSDKLKDLRAEYDARVSQSIADLDNPKGIRAYHGSPHDFDRFSMDKIGTGEGHQVYGHGLYFAENPAVAREYRENVKDMGKVGDINAELSELAAIMHKHAIPGQYRKYRSPEGEQAAARYDDLMAQREGVVDAPGRMYEVNIRADPDEFLDWDKPLSEQSKKVREVLRGISTQSARDPGPGQPVGAGISRAFRNEIFGGDLVRKGVGKATPNEVQEGLREAGIPGIKYLDQGSRQAGEGSRNYVLFRDDIIDVVKKYGIAGAAAMLGMSQADIAEAAGNETGPSFDDLLNSAPDFTGG